ncbi:FAD-binding domain-containing protein [Bimuria novae-zelandiae CBS 107.79]|uniref:FAD-binding domain-containing protein n=1 Tax=Bimuria novae-zelandiae CBS 107.79 TaxID=1447943 RepID=A0A6A5VQ27_9PLEO|nr:FAD-binding domain-containing protein [Bimuria novae-zelandiae CBS 107.79]
MYFHTLCIAALASTGAAATCKTTPLDAEWPSETEWAQLNTTIAGSLIRTVPIASSCYSGNDFGSAPESIDYPIYANNSCLPTNVTGYSPDQGCSIGAYPQYIVNATEEEHVAIATKWASERNIRIVIKGTGHDLNGRSSGAWSLSIWTRNFRSITRDTAWTYSNSSTPQDVYIVGSGQQWGNVLDRALSEGRIVTTGQDPSVGLGGYIQGGGHGPILSTYGLASAQVLQMRVVTATERASFWALRGGGAGHNVVMSNVMIMPQFATNESFEASWSAAARWLSHLPDLMEAGLAGAATAASGETAFAFFPNLANMAPFGGLGYGQLFWAFNTTVAAYPSTAPGNGTNSTLEITMSTSNAGNYSAFYWAISGSEVAGGASLTSTRLLGRAELVDTPHEDVMSYLKVAFGAENKTAGSFSTIGLQGGPGVHNMPEERRELDPVAAGSPQAALESAAAFYEEKHESMWRKWSPESGAYMNEANAFNKEFKHDFYGENHERLLEVKRKYDPEESFFVLAGVGSDNWDYNMDSGKLCRVGNGTYV